MKGDVGLTFTLDTGAAATVLVSGPRTGRPADDRDGRTVTAARGELDLPAEPDTGRRGTGAQEDNGNLGKGRTGRIS
jgi:hypothetical protein